MPRENKRFLRPYMDKNQVPEWTIKARFMHDTVPHNSPHTLTAESDPASDLKFGPKLTVVNAHVNAW